MLRWKMLKRFFTDSYIYFGLIVKEFRQKEPITFQVLSHQLHLIKYIYIYEKKWHFRRATQSKSRRNIRALTTSKMLVLLTTLKRCSGTMDTKEWRVSGVILSHSSCKDVLRFSTAYSCRCLQNSPHILCFLFLSHSVCNMCRMRFCMNIPGKDVDLKAPYLFLCINAVITDV